MSTIVNIWEKLSAADIMIEQTRCAKVRNRHAQCTRCADACTTGCISYADNELIISPEKCIGCATCATACPTDALMPKRPTDPELHRACISAGQANNGRITLACRQLLDAADGLYDADKVVGVPCLGRVDEALIVHLATIGAAGVSLVTGPCETCEYHRGRGVAAAALANANLLLETWGSPVRASMCEKLPASTRLTEDPGYDQSRSAFFMTAGEEAREFARTAVATTLEDVFDMREEQPSRFVHVDERGTLPHSISVRRTLLLRCLDALAQRNGGPADVMINTGLASQVIIDTDVCNSCRMCATFCPTGANFKFATRTGGVGVKHRVRQCTDCRLCGDICPTHALTFSDEIFARDVAEGTVERFLMRATDARYGSQDAVLETVRPLMNENVPIAQYGERK